MLCPQTEWIPYITFCSIGIRTNMERYINVFLFVCWWFYGIIYPTPPSLIPSPILETYTPFESASITDYLSAKNYFRLRSVLALKRLKLLNVGKFFETGFIFQKMSNEKHMLICMNHNRTSKIFSYFCRVLAAFFSFFH